MHMKVQNWKWAAADLVLSSEHAVQSKVKRAAAGQNKNCMGWLGQRSREMARDIWLVLRVRSFQLIVLQVSVTSALQPPPKPSALLGEQDNSPFSLGKPVDYHREAVACHQSHHWTSPLNMSTTDIGTPCLCSHQHREHHKRTECRSEHSPMHAGDCGDDAMGGAGIHHAVPAAAGLHQPQHRHLGRHILSGLRHRQPWWRCYW